MVRLLIEFYSSEGLSHFQDTANTIQKQKRLKRIETYFFVSTGRMKGFELVLRQDQH